MFNNTPIENRNRLLGVRQMVTYKLDGLNIKHEVI